MSQEVKELSSRGQQFNAIQLFTKKEQLFTKKELTRPLLIAIVIQVAQQWSGINAVSSSKNNKLHSDKYRCAIIHSFINLNKYSFLFFNRYFTTQSLYLKRPVYLLITYLMP